MHDAVPRSSRLRLVALTIFALLASLLGVVSTSQSASAEIIYGGVKLVDTEGHPVANTSIYLFSVNPPEETFVYATNGDGVSRFSNTDLPDGPVTVMFDYYPVGGPGGIYTWTGDSTLVEGNDNPQAATFDGSSPTLLEVTLPVDQPNGGISGKRTLSPAPATTTGGSVSLYTPGGEHVAMALVAADGSYVFRGVPAGSYKLSFNTVSGSSAYPGRWYKDAADITTATTVAVGTSVVANINQTLLAVPTVRGILGEGAAGFGAPTVAFFPSSWTTPNWSSSDVRWAYVEDGAYSIQLEPGSYRVAFGNRVSGGSAFVPHEYWGPSATVAGSRVLTLTWGDRKAVSGLGAKTFSDAAGNQFEFEITWLAEQGVTTGYPNGTFLPLGTVNRDAMAAFIYRFVGSPDFSPPPVSPFVDVPTSNQFYKEISWLAWAGISTGWDVGGGKKEFRPLQPVARDAMAAFLFRAARSPAEYEPPYATSPFVDVPMTHPFYKEITWLAIHGISTGYDVSGGNKEYRPLASVNRDAMAAFLYRFPSWYRYGWVPA